MHPSCLCQRAPAITPLGLLLGKPDREINARGLILGGWQHALLQGKVGHHGQVRQIPVGIPVCLFGVPRRLACPINERSTSASYLDEIEITFNYLRGATQARSVPEGRISLMALLCCLPEIYAILRQRVSH